MARSAWAERQLETEDCKRGVRIKPTSLSGLSEAAKGHWHLPHSAANGRN